MNYLKCVLILIAGLLTGATASAQEVLYSPYQDMDLRQGDFSVVGKTGGRLYTYRSNPDGFFLDAYNDSMEHLATVVLDFFPLKIYDTRFIAYPNQIVVLYQALNRNEVVQYAALLDERGRLLQGPLALDSARTGLFGTSRSYFSSVVSDDKRHILIYATNTRRNELRFSGIWLNEQLQITGRSQADYQGDNDLAAGDALLGPDGSLYLHVSAPTGNKGFSDQLLLLALQPGGRQFKIQELPLGERYVTGVYLKQDQVNNRIYISGFFSEKKNGNQDGVVYAWFDLGTYTFRNQKMIVFDDRLRRATGENNKRRAFNDFKMRQIIVRNDGGFVLVAEDYFMTNRNAGYVPGWGYYSSYYYGPYMMPTVREFHYNDILVLSYDGAGQRQWHAFVRKNQYSQEDGGLFSSYAMINTGGSLGFLFNDFNTSQSRIQLATVDADGQQAVRHLAAGGAGEPDWLPRSGRQVGPSELVVPCLRKRQICFAKVVF
jgi:hypothetical protein